MDGRLALDVGNVKALRQNHNREPTDNLVVTRNTRLGRVLYVGEIIQTPRRIHKHRRIRIGIQIQMQARRLHHIAFFRVLRGEPCDSRVVVSGLGVIETALRVLQVPDKSNGLVVRGRKLSPGAVRLRDAQGTPGALLRDDLTPGVVPCSSADGTVTAIALKAPTARDPRSRPSWWEPASKGASCLHT